MVNSRTGRSTKVGAEVGTKPIQSFTKAKIMGEQKLYISKRSLLEKKENGNTCTKGQRQGTMSRVQGRGMRSVPEL